MAVEMRPESGLMALWAKQKSNDPEQRGYHPLLYHLLDVAGVAEVVWQSVLADPERRRIAASLRLDVEEAKRWIAFLAGTHDIGKACPLFQLQEAKAHDRLRRAGFPCGAVAGPAPHGSVSTVALREILRERGVPDDQVELLAVAIGGHHGLFPQRYDLNHLGVEAVGREPWAGVRRRLAEELAREVGLPPAVPHVDLHMAIWLAGYISVVDWIGSNQDFFRFAAPDHTQTPGRDGDYRRQALEQAGEALGALGWLAQPPAGQRGQSFEDLFAREPNAMQQAVMGVEGNLTGPGLVIIEAPTGSGKTEAALWLANRWGERLGQRGFYIALPTQATSNQMFDRVTEFLHHLYPSDVISVQLLHSHASLSEAVAELRREGYRLFQPADVFDETSDRSGVAVAEWFTHRKRGLLAPFGVGTIDQALLAVLQVKHVFVRLFGLAGKTVVVDEVHAYDTYMSTLLERLLEWLGALGTSVVMLSATLPDERRRALAGAYRRGQDPTWTPDIPAASYPRITVVGGSARPETIHLELPDSDRRTLRLERTEPLLATAGDGTPLLARRLHQSLDGGGCAAVICNTVHRAQEVYRLLQPYFSGRCDDGALELDLIHARFLWEERLKREQRVLRRFGKPEDGLQGQTVQRPKRAVLVSTQIIEQSLDIDFDLMVSELAPADLLLQRAGRLGRHRRPDRPLDGLTLWIAGPSTDEAGLPTFDRGWEAVYSPHILLRTWLALRDRVLLETPDQVEALIEAVYGKGEPPAEARLLARWQQSLAEMRKDQGEEEKEARKNYIAPPTLEDLGHLVSTAREEDAPELHPAAQAMTRLMEPTVTVIALAGREGEALLDGKPCDLERKPDHHTTARLLEHSVSLGDKRVYYPLVKIEPPKGWSESPQLRRCRLLVLDGERVEIGNHELRVDPELGVVIDDERRKHGNL